MRRGGRARLKASDSKSDRGPEGPSGVQILSPPPIFVATGLIEPRRRGDRAAEGAALEMPCTGNPCAAGSNPAPSANHISRRSSCAGLRRSTVGQRPPWLLRRSTVGRRPPWLALAPDGRRSDALDQF